MSELKTKIAAGAVLAIVSAVILGLGTAAYLPPQQASTSTVTMSTTSRATTTATASSSTLITSSSTISTSMAVTTISSATAVAQPIVYSGKTVGIDPTLQASLFQSIFLSSNATEIANRVASALSELPITLASVAPQCANCGGGTTAYRETYSYRTANGSSIVVTLVQGAFYQLDYNRSLTSSSSAPESRFVVASASSVAASIMTSLGIPVGNASVVDERFSLSPGAFELEWSQGIGGVPLTGALVANSSGDYVRSIYAYFQFHPQSSQLTGMTIAGADWYQIPSSFPLRIGSSEAIARAADYAAGSLGATIITSAQVSFAAIQNHVYYAVTLDIGGNSYVLFVNPRTGEVGLPTE